MALARCRACGRPKARGGTGAYVASAEPLGYFLTAAVCGASGCERPALIWLTAREKAAFDNGERVFGLSAPATKVQGIKVRVTTLV
ncbi:MAG TPA: hypothetical protein VMQ11_02180 [Alphaproteobacteria bacterium]|nr:hypothetical protein [Alphaproteobacteria bacterium]